MFLTRIQGKLVGRVQCWATQSQSFRVGKIIRYLFPTQWPPVALLLLLSWFDCEVTFAVTHYPCFCFLVGWCLGECRCSCSAPCQGKQTANRSFPLLVKRQASQQTSCCDVSPWWCYHKGLQLALCACVRVWQREGDGQMDREQADRARQ